jgi:hypothetical protein
MFEPDRHAPACVYALADSLDAILAACEDLPSTTSKPALISPSHLTRAVVAIVLQARRHIRELDPLEPGLVQGCANFLVATSEVAINRSSSDPAQPEKFLLVADDHRSAEHMSLGIIAQLAGNLLDILEAHYVLYDDEQLTESEPSIRGIAPVERRSHAP